jgi:hypothetical protein
MEQTVRRHVSSGTSWNRVFKSCASREVVSSEQVVEMCPRTLFKYRSTSGNLNRAPPENKKAEISISITRVVEARLEGSLSVCRYQRP